MSDEAPEKLRLVEDLCNSATLLHGVDELATLAQANEWLERNGWPSLGSEQHAARLRQEREVIRGFLIDRSDPGARHALNALFQQHWAAAHIDDAGRLAFSPTEHAVSPTGAAVEALMLHGLDASGQRLKACASEECRWVFYDNSRSRNRTWCDMNICGARHKMRQYRARLDTPAV